MLESGFLLTSTHRGSATSARCCPALAWPQGLALESAANEPRQKTSRRGAAPCPARAGPRGLGDLSAPRSQHRRGELGEGEGNSVKVTKGDGGFRSGAHAALRTWSRSGGRSPCPAPQAHFSLTFVPLAAAIWGPCGWHGGGIPISCGTQALCICLDPTKPSPKATPQRRRRAGAPSSGWRKPPWVKDLGALTNTQALLQP